MNATNSSTGKIRLAGDLSGSNDALNPQLPATTVVPGSYSNPNIIVNSKGLITSASSGSNIDIFNIPYATTTSPGVVQIGTGLSMSSGVLSIPYATTTSPGVVQIGTQFQLIPMLGFPGYSYLALAAEVVPTISGGFNGGIGTVPVTVSSATGTITLDFSQSNVFDLTLTGNINLNAPSALRRGGKYYIVLRQDTTGGRTLTLNSAFKLEAGTTSTLTSTPNAIDVLQIIVHGTSTPEFLCRLIKNFV